MGTGRNIFRERPELAIFLKEYNKEKEEEINEILLDIVAKMALKQLESEKKATQLGVSRFTYENHLETVSKLLFNRRELIIKKDFINGLMRRINSTKIYREKIDQVIIEFNRQKEDKLIFLIDKMFKERGKISKYNLWDNNREIFNRSDVYSTETEDLIKKRLKMRSKKSNTKKNVSQDLDRYLA
ncbi:MAG: hypothetical protein ACW967_01590 [Candidatus Hodarchaeales archaeon]|jgi:hypothetical protein